MANMSKLSAAVQRAIDSHLDAIETSLRAAGVSRSERQSIIENMENQINEMLAARIEGTPAEDDVRSLLAELDAPESFADTLDVRTNEPLPAANAVAQPSLRRISKSAVIGALWAVPFLTFVPLYIIGLAFPPGSIGILFSGIFDWWPVPITLTFATLTAPAVTTLLGIISISQIRHSRGTLYGRGLAIADALLFPLLAALAVCVAVAGAVMVFLHRPGEFLDPSYNHQWKEVLLDPPSFLGFAVAIAVWFLVAYVTTWRIARRTRRPLPGDDVRAN